MNSFIADDAPGGSRGGSGGRGGRRPGAGRPAQVGTQRAINEFAT